MSYDIELCGDDGKCVEVAKHNEGGTIPIGGSDCADMSLTYNYSGIYRECGFSIRDLDGKRAADTIDMLAAVVMALGTIRDPDYWAATRGNAGHAANVLLGWARQYPEAKWRVA